MKCQVFWSILASFSDLGVIIDPSKNILNLGLSSKIINITYTPIQYNSTFYGCKTKSFRWKKYNIFVSFARNRDCGYSLGGSNWGGSNGYPQSILGSRNKKKIMYTTANPIFFYIKVGFEGSKLDRHVFVVGPENINLHYSEVQRDVLWPLKWSTGRRFTATTRYQHQLNRR